MDGRMGAIVNSICSDTLCMQDAIIVPAIAITGSFHPALFTGHSKSQQEYWEAGSIAEQVRTVYSFVGEKQALDSYSKAFQTTLKLGYKTGMEKGLAMGVTYGVIFCH
ncbi:unnamed protein product [Sphagnum troendelagicum]|uniref:Uncharacterized protein n=1 Tax=Sphagnum troendelagicum TaxID=128251 RepID=A0ABP0TV90_9BRYO